MTLVSGINPLVIVLLDLVRINSVNEKRKVPLYTSDVDDSVEQVNLVGKNYRTRPDGHFSTATSDKTTSQMRL